MKPYEKIKRFMNKNNTDIDSLEFLSNKKMINWTHKQDDTLYSPDANYQHSRRIMLENLIFNRCAYKIAKILDIIK